MSGTTRRRGPRRPSVRSVLRAAFVVVLLAFLLVALGDRWEDVRPELGRLSPQALIGAALAVLAGLWCAFLTWRALLTDLGFPLPLSGGARVFFLGQLSKYIPGSVWPALAQMELGRDYRVPPRASGATVVIFMMLTIGVGLLVATVTLPLLGVEAYRDYLWVLAVVPVALVVLAPPVLNRLLALLLRLARRQPMPAPLTAVGIARASFWALCSWALFGVHVWLLARDLGAASPQLYLASTGAFAGALAAGFLFVVAPAGAGVREAMLVVLLSSRLPTGAATAIAITSRLLFTAGDAACGGLAVLAARYRRGFRRWPEADEVDGSAGSPPTSDNRTSAEGGRWSEDDHARLP